MSDVSVEALALGDPRLDGLKQHTGPLYDDWVSAWSALSPGERDPLSHPVWVAAHLAYPPRDAPIEVVLFKTHTKSPRLLGILPLVVERAASPRHLEGFYSASVALPTAQLHECLVAFFRNRLGTGRRPRSLVLGRVDGTNALLSAAWPMFTVASGYRSTITVPCDYDVFLAGLSKNFRGNLRKARNKLEAAGAVAVEVAMTPGEVEDGIRRYVELESRSWKEARATSLSHDENQRRSLAAALGAWARTGGASVHLLSVHGADIAGQLCYRDGAELYVLKTSYDQERMRFAPGNMLLERTLRDWCPTAGIECVNLVTGLDWHANWRPVRDPVYRAVVFARGPVGLAGRLLDGAPRDRAKAVVRLSGLEPLARRVLAWRRATRR